MAFRTNKTPVLQEKSASGSVATFNTALAMPLVNGEFSIQAYQEGSGDPSPVNERNIIGYSAVNITHAHKNLFDINNLTATDITISDNVAVGTISTFYNAFRVASGGIPNLPKFKTNTRYTFSLKAKYDNNSFGNVEGLYFNAYYTDGTRSRLLSDEIALDTTDYVTFTGTTEANKTLDRITITYGTGGNVNIYLKDIQLEESLQATDFEAYNADVKTKQLGETVYGGSYNSVSGVKRKTHEIITFDGSNDENWIYYNNQAFLIDNAFANASANFVTNYNNPVCLCNLYRETIVLGGSNQLPQWPDVTFFNQSGYNKRLWIKDSSITSLDDFKDMLSNTPLQIVYPIAEPIETNIGATPISTNIGNNNIFADTGDIDLTFKDLDIAKRGSFREVFRLPS